VRSAAGVGRWGRSRVLAAGLLLRRVDEADGPLGRIGRGHQLADGIEDAGDGLVVGGELAL